MKLDGTAHTTDSSVPDASAEQALLSQVRRGDNAAFGRLYEAHEPAARRLASILAGPDHADDLASESFARILNLLQTGGGPTSNFRGYLYATIRNRYRDSLRASRERPSSDLPWVLDSEEPPAEELVEGIDSNGALAALSTLPDTWQKVLWHLEVEGRKPAEIADSLAMSSAAVSSLAYRARDRLRRAYLDQHLDNTSVASQCQWSRSRLSQYVRSDLSRRASARVADHLSGCVGCAAAYSEMDALNKRLAAYLFPLVLAGGMGALETAGLSTGGTASLAGALQSRAEGRASGGATGMASGLRVGSISLPAPAAAALGLALVAVLATGVWAATTKDGSDPTAAPDTKVRVEPPPPPQVDPPAPAMPEPSPTPTPRPVSEEPVPVAIVPAVDLDPPTSQPAPEKSPVAVRPRAPRVVAITACGTYGSVTPATTPGVRYELTRGDGRQGPWTVRASARNGYVLAPGTPSRFTGDLGQYQACPPPVSLGAVSKVSQGAPATDPWDIAVTPVVTDPGPHTLQVTYVFDTGALIKSRSGTGWTCREPGGVEVGAGTEYYFPDPQTAFTCTFDYTGVAPPPVTLSLFATDANMQVVEPTGQVSLSSDGAVVGERAIS